MSKIRKTVVAFVVAFVAFAGLNVLTASAADAKSSRSISDCNTYKGKRGLQAPTVKVKKGRVKANLSCSGKEYDMLVVVYVPYQQYPGAEAFWAQGGEVTTSPKPTLLSGLVNISFTYRWDDGSKTEFLFKEVLIQ